jgi:hypothetical protein
MQVLVVAVQNAVDHRDLGAATSSNLFFRSMGASFGTAVFGAIVAAGVSNRVAGLSGTAGLDADSLTNSPEAINALPAAIHDPVVVAFSDAITFAFAFAVPLTLIAFALTFFIPELPLRQVAHVSAAAEGGEIPAGEPA